MKYTIGQRVTRDERILEHFGRNCLLVGTIIKAYSDYERKYGPYPELYDVLWDGDTKVSKGYLPHGITLNSL